MARKCFISFKTEDLDYKKYIQDDLRVEMVDKSLDQSISSVDEDYILRKIRSDYLSDSTVTIHLIGAFSAEHKGYQEQRFIKRELQASLYDGEGNTQSGILGIALPSVEPLIFRGAATCRHCGAAHNIVVIDDNTVVREFSYNYYIPHGRCSHTEAERYCVLATWERFCREPEEYIEQAFRKRGESIASQVRVYGTGAPQAAPQQEVATAGVWA